MTYTIFDTSTTEPHGVVVPTVIDALAFAREVDRRAAKSPIVAAENGWLLTVDELEELART